MHTIVESAHKSFLNMDLVHNPNNHNPCSSKSQQVITPTGTKSQKRDQEQLIERQLTEAD
jgi:hypothetical protein